jgi:hypothetical protein
MAAAMCSRKSLEFVGRLSLVVGEHDGTAGEGVRPRPTARCGQVAGGAGCSGCSGGIAPLQPPGGGGAGKVLLPLSPTQS